MANKLYMATRLSNTENSCAAKDLNGNKARLGEIFGSVSSFLNTPYSPPLIYKLLPFNGNLDTVLPALARKSKCHTEVDVQYTRELLRLPDGGTIAVDWAGRQNSTAKSSSSPQRQSKKAKYDPIDPKQANADESTCESEHELNNSVIVLLHGMAGSSDSHYIKYMAHEFLKVCPRVAVVVSRGCGDVPLTSPAYFNGSRIEDFKYAFMHIAKKHRHLPMYACGFSLGSALLMKYLGTEGPAEPFLEGAVGICPPWNFHTRDPWFPAWERNVLLEGCKQVVRNEKDNFDKSLSEHPDKPVPDLDRALEAKTLAEFDKYLQVPLLGDQGAFCSDQYFTLCSPAIVSHRIDVPTLTIQALNDHVCPKVGWVELDFYTEDKTEMKTGAYYTPELAPLDVPANVDKDSSFVVGPGLVTVYTERGGHTAYPLAKHTWANFLNDSFGWSTRAWQDDVTTKWLTECAKHLPKDAHLESSKTLGPVKWWRSVIQTDMLMLYMSTNYKVTLSGGAYNYTPFSGPESQNGVDNDVQKHTNEDIPSSVPPSSVPEGNISVRVDQYSKDLGEVLLFHRCYKQMPNVSDDKVLGALFITAWNPYSQSVTVEENQNRNKSLVADIEEAGYAYYSFVGEGDEEAPSGPADDRKHVPQGEKWAEPGYCVMRVTLLDACKLGRKYAQNAVLWAEMDHYVPRAAVPRLVLLR